MFHKRFSNLMITRAIHLRTAWLRVTVRFRYRLTALVLGFSFFAQTLGAVDFVHQVAPILKKNCAECHMGTKHKGGFSMNTREELMKQNDDGYVLEPGDSKKSLLMHLVTSDDEDERMPPKGAGLQQEEVAILAAWIDAGASWEPGFSFKKKTYEPPLRLSRPVLPTAVDGRDHPLDRILDAYTAKHKIARPQEIDEASFARRVHLDITGMLPAPAVLQTYLASDSRVKRAKLVEALLDDDQAYATHWLSFWNDLLRNDYAGTGYIDGGRKQISDWLYRSLLENKPYNQFAAELIAPSDKSAGFANGIKWRGEVSAGQKVPIQYAQSVGQTFLGINLKCASCHDSFTDNWKLTDSYGLAAAFSLEKIEIARCDKPTGKIAEPYWLYPELGKIDPSLPPAERLKQVAQLTTTPANGRFSRTIVNRLWHRLMGRGIVHPVDAMSSEPWNENLLDYLANYLIDQNYDLKKVIAHICSSKAYQSKAQTLESDDEGKWQYAGPRAKRMTAEEFVDAIWQITATTPSKPDFAAPIASAETSGTATPAFWVWSDGGNDAKAGETIALKKVVELKQGLVTATAVVTCDNEFALRVNGKEIAKGNDWASPLVIDLLPHLHQGSNEIVILATNTGTAPNPAGCYFKAKFVHEGTTTHLGTDESWLATSAPDDEINAAGWHPAVKCANPKLWDSSKPGFTGSLASLSNNSSVTVRAALMKSDELMRSLGRPNREQIVTSRPNDLTTLEAMDFNNGGILADILAKGARHILATHGSDGPALIENIYLQALSRSPSVEEKDIALKIVGTALLPATVEDFLWSVLMLPEFQLIR